MFCSLGVFADEPEKLVNGIPTSVDEYPHAVSIRVNNNHFCGGSIISNNMIITAGHCVAPLIQNANQRQGLTVVTGTTYLSSGGQAHRVSRMWYHERYNPNTPGRDAGFDIGLLQVWTWDKSCYIRFIYVVTFSMHIFRDIAINITLYNDEITIDIPAHSYFKNIFSSPRPFPSTPDKGQSGFQRRMWWGVNPLRS